MRIKVAVSALLLCLSFAGSTSVVAAEKAPKKEASRQLKRPPADALAQLMKQANVEEPPPFCAEPKPVVVRQASWDDCRAEGKACQYGTECCGGRCSFGRCGDCKSNGEQCDYNSDCCSRHCDGHVCAGCKPKGDACQWNSDCCGGRCSFNVCRS